MDRSDNNAKGIPKTHPNVRVNQHTRGQNGPSDGQQTPESTLLLDASAADEKTGCSGGPEKVDEVIEVEQVKEKRLFYKISETPPLPLVLLTALQQGLLPVANALVVSTLVVELACGRDDGEFRTLLLSSTFLMIGLSTFTMSTFGVRLPIFQGPAATYIIPIFGLMTMDEWKCPTQQDLAAYYGNGTMNLTNTTDEPLLIPKDFIFNRMRKLSGSLMVAGGLHFAIGITGLVGFMLRFIGPVTIVPAITLVGLYIYKVVVKFCETNWTVAFTVASSGVLLSMHLGKRSTPVPAWSRQRGFHVKWYPLHQVFAILMSIIIGWSLSAIYTHFNWLSKDQNSLEYYARTDTQLHIIHDSAWFSLPYPGQFGIPVFHAGAFISCFLATLMSVLDSIGDYNACARMCYVPRPPGWAVNRGIAVEGLMSLLSGAVGTGQATVSYGGNIGAIGLTKVASRRVFQAVGVMYVLMAVFSKIGAVFITVPYSVLGGTQILTMGIFIGIVLSNLQHVDLGATRNVAIIGISLLLGLMIPYWVALRPNGVQTGNEEANRMISILLGNPVFVGGFLACFLDNTIPGTLKQRGIILDTPKKEKKSETLHGKVIPVSDDEDNDDNAVGKDDEFEEGLEVYQLPWIPDSIQRSSLAKIVRIFPGTGQRSRGFTGMNM